MSRRHDVVQFTIISRSHGCGALGKVACTCKCRVAIYVSRDATDLKHNLECQRSINTVSKSKGSLETAKRSLASFE